MEQICTRKKVFKQLNVFSLPLIFNQFFNIIITTLLATIIGRISMNAIASTEVVDNFLYAFIGILGVGTLAFNICASRVRTTKPKEFYNWFKSILELNLIIGITAVVLTVIFSGLLLKYLYSFNGKVLRIGTLYANIQSFSILFNMLIFAMSNLLKVVKKTKQIFIIGIISSIFQLIVSYVLVYFVFEGEYRIVGIALASIMTLFIEVVSYIYLLRNEFKKIRGIKSTKKVEIIKISLPLAGQEILEGSIFQVLIVALISNLGLNILSSYGIAVKMIMIALVPMYMYCNALTVLVGENIESKNIDVLKLLPRLTTLITLCVYIVFCFVFYIFKDYMASFYTNISVVKDQLKQIVLYVFILSSFQIFFENTKYALQSLGEAKLTLKITGIVNMIIMIVLFSLYKLNVLTLFNILFILALNYSVLSIIFYIYYNKLILKKVAM